MTIKFASLSLVFTSVLAGFSGAVQARAINQTYQDVPVSTLDIVINRLECGAYAPVTTFNNVGYVQCQGYIEGYGWFGTSGHTRLQNQDMNSRAIIAQKACAEVRTSHVLRWMPGRKGGDGTALVFLTPSTTGNLTVSYTVPISCIME